MVYIYKYLYILLAAEILAQRNSWYGISKAFSYASKCLKHENSQAESSLGRKFELV